ncbi:protein hairy [Diabrotica virgifera virgifera]|uniref:Protein hairy n=1 Tax=Diabrotica virgifera virgifera TaxID=50390 RepID=A0A6P7EYJ1_DIAVI|nr:protein hairy [Diabrotica virgifera virgifera]
MVTTTNAVTSTSMIQGNSTTPTSNTPGTGENNNGVKRISDNRRSNKPIMEKRRRARINNCLNELKTLILDAMKKDPARHSKLEKADILEMTVKHLQNLQRQQVAMSAAADPLVVNKFRAGFSECASEVGRFPGLDPIVRRRLLQHLANCLSQGSKPQEVPQVQVHILPNTQKPLEQQVPQSSGIILSNGNGTGVQLVPTRLPNGDLALVLPTTLQTQPQYSPAAVPLLVPIVPERTASTTSATSSYSNYSPSHSPEPMESMYSQPKPLSLVVRKAEPEEDKPWRPW